MKSTESEAIFGQFAQPDEDRHASPRDQDTAAPYRNKFLRFVQFWGMEWRAAGTHWKFGNLYGRASPEGLALLAALHIGSSACATGKEKSYPAGDH